MVSQDVDSIRLDIGGTRFERSKSSLRIDATYFCDLVEKKTPDKDGFIFIDRSPKHFPLILDYMQGTPFYFPRSEKEIQEVKNEAKFYRLPGIFELLFNSEEIPWNLVIDLETFLLKSKNILEKQIVAIFCLFDENRGFVRRPEKFDIIDFMKAYKDKVDIKFVIHSSQSIPISAFWNYRIYEKSGRETRGPSKAEYFVAHLEKDMKNAIHRARGPITKLVEMLFGMQVSPYVLSLNLAIQRTCRPITNLIKMLFDMWVIPLFAYVQSLKQISKDNGIEFYVDGSSMRNGYSFSKGGWGVYCKTTGVHWKGYCREGRQTNVVYELIAALVATHKAKDVTQQIIRIYSDSKYTVESTNLYSFKWNSFGWLKSRNDPIENLEIIKAIDNNFQKLRNAGKTISIQHVKRKHNKTADKLADSARDEHIWEFMQAFKRDNSELYSDLVEYEDRAKICKKFEKTFQENIGNNPGDSWKEVYETIPQVSLSIDGFII